MLRTLLLAAVLVAIPPVVRGDTPPPPTVVVLTVQPMSAPKPALRYPLLPDLKEMQPGNPIQGYLKCFGEQQHFFSHKTAMENREKWQAMPLKDLPVKELRDYGGAALKQADLAARLDTPDWQILLQLRREGVNLLLPDVQQMRMLASALRVRLRGEVADGRFEDALRTARTMFALARHLGEHPTLIGDLVGLAIANMAVLSLEEMVQQPGCPNLYWSLTDLPSPFIDMRMGTRGERFLLEAEFAPFDSSTPLSEAQLEQAVARLDRLFAGMELTYGLWAGGPSLPAPPQPVRKVEKKKTAREWLTDRARDAKWVAAARARLVESGLAAEAVRRLPALQVVLLDEKWAFEILIDDWRKWRAVPTFEALARRNVKAQSEAEQWLFSRLLPSNRLLLARTRLDRRIALLRHCEALRLSAADHAGTLPPRLADVALPLPVDPFTGKPFPYRVEQGKAVLRGTPPPGFEKDPSYHLHYEVHLRKLADR